MFADLTDCFSMTGGWLSKLFGKSKPKPQTTEPQTDERVFR